VRSVAAIVVGGVLGVDIDTIQREKYKILIKDN
jgi:hypothetical protein